MSNQRIIPQPGFPKPETHGDDDWLQCPRCGTIYELPCEGRQINAESQFEMTCVCGAVLVVTVKYVAELTARVKEEPTP